MTKYFIETNPSRQVKLTPTASLLNFHSQVSAIRFKVKKIVVEESQLKIPLEKAR